MHLLLSFAALCALSSPLAFACESSLDPALLRDSIARGEWDSPFFNFEADLRSSARGFTVLGYENSREKTVRDYFLRSGWGAKIGDIKEYLERELQAGRLTLTNETYSGTIQGQAIQIFISNRADDDFGLRIEAWIPREGGETVHRVAGFVYRTDLHEASRRWKAQNTSQRLATSEDLMAYIDAQLKPVSMETIADPMTLDWVNSFLASIVTPPEQAASVTFSAVTEWLALDQRFIALGARLPLRNAIQNLAERRTSKRVGSLIRARVSHYELTIEEPEAEASIVRIWVQNQSNYGRPHPVESYSLPLSVGGVAYSGPTGPSSALLPEIYSLMLGASRSRNASSAEL
jgi:hypothetical protein